MLTAAEMTSRCVRVLAMPQGARNLLVWSPLFLPTVEGLMRRGGESGNRGPRTRIKANNPREARHPAPHPRAQAVAAERMEHIAKLKAMYMGGAEQQRHEAGGADVTVRLPVPLPEQQQPEDLVPPARQGSAGASTQGSPRPQLRERSPSAPPVGSSPRAAVDGGGGGGVEDEWEDEVDDLLNWTSGLPAGME